MSKFSSFLRKFAPEYRTLAGTLETVALGVALNPADREKVLAATRAIGAAADNIEAHLGEVEQAEAAGIDHTALRETMKKLLPDIIGGMSEAAIRAILDKKTATPKAPKAPKGATKP